MVPTPSSAVPQAKGSLKSHLTLAGTTSSPRPHPTAKPTRASAPLLNIISSMLLNPPRPRYYLPAWIPPSNSFRLPPRTAPSLEDPPPPPTSNPSTRSTAPHPTTWSSKPGKNGTNPGSTTSPQTYTCTNREIIEVDGQVAGFLEVRFNPDHIFLAIIELSPTIQRHGIGTQLIKEILSQAITLQQPVRPQLLKANTRPIPLRTIGFLKPSQTNTH